MVVLSTKNTYSTRTLRLVDDIEKATKSTKAVLPGLRVFSYPRTAHINGLCIKVYSYKFSKTDDANIYNSHACMCMCTQISFSGKQCNAK